MSRTKGIEQRNRGFNFGFAVYRVTNTAWFELTSFFVALFCFTILTWTFAAWLAVSHYDDTYGDNPQMYPAVGYPDRPQFWEFNYGAQDWLVGGLCALIATGVIAAIVAFLSSWIIKRFYYRD